MKVFQVMFKGRCIMVGGYDDCDGKIWLDGELVDWWFVNVYILSYVMYYVSFVFEGECVYNGKIFKSVEYFECLLKFGEMLDMLIFYIVEEIEVVKYVVFEVNGLSDVYVCVVVWCGVGDDMGVVFLKNLVCVVVVVWEWGVYYGDVKFQGVKFDIVKWKCLLFEIILIVVKVVGFYMICIMFKYVVEVKGCLDVLFYDYCGYVVEVIGVNVFFVKDGEVYMLILDVILNGIICQIVIQMLKDKGVIVYECYIMLEEFGIFE